MLETGMKRNSSVVVVANNNKEFKCREFSKEINIEKGIDRLSYGMNISRVVQKGKSRIQLAAFFISDEDSTKLQWITDNRDLRKTRLDLWTVTSVSESVSVPLNKKLKGFAPLILTIFYSSTQENAVDFQYDWGKVGVVGGAWIFHSKGAWTSKDKIVRVLVLWSHRYMISFYFFRISSPAVIARDLFDKADVNNDKLLEKDEIKQILKKMQISIDNKTLNARFSAFDKDKNGVFDKREFDLFIQSLLRKNELIPLFSKYAKDYNGVDDMSVMATDELIRFYKEEQNTILSDEGGCRYNQSGEKRGNYNWGPPSEGLETIVLRFQHVDILKLESYF